ncbi:MAG: hypothetical protein Q8M98_04015 [Candidatus Cloacimonadaceae bacterium]|nr:hypothetical protein [Candidatus Cloacimonadaceae bacterium]MDP3113924.1 hypothetical protein [Candidatus Cloacimonadaceae bacterium]
MDICLKSIEALSENFQRYRFGLKRDQFCLFGLLLDSIEGIGTHHCGDHEDEMLVSVSRSRISEFETYLFCWQGFMPDPVKGKRGNPALRLTEISR